MLSNLNVCCFSLLFAYLHFLQALIHKGLSSIFEPTFSPTPPKSQMHKNTQQLFALFRSFVEKSQVQKLALSKARVFLYSARFSKYSFHRRHCRRIRRDIVQKLTMPATFLLWVREPICA